MTKTDLLDFILNDLKLTRTEAEQVILELSIQGSIHIVRDITST